MTVSFSVPILAAALLALAALASSCQDHSNGWSKIASLFDPPVEYRGDYGPYASVLTFDDGLPVRTAGDWAKRREEIRRDWVRELGTWPAPIKKPTSRILGEEHVENFARK